MQRILLVEDHPDVRVLLENVLVGAGYVLDVAETVTAARRFLAVNAYALIIADGGFPDGTGIEVADAAAAAEVKTLLILGNVSLFDKHDLQRFEHLTTQFITSFSSAANRTPAAISATTRWPSEPRRAQDPSGR